MDHPNGGSYETQADRFGSTASMRAPYSEVGRPYVSPQPQVKVERSFPFSEEDIKAILAKYVRDNFSVDAEVKDVTGDYRQATYGSQFDSSSGYCRFTVKVRG